MDKFNYALFKDYMLDKVDNLAHIKYYQKRLLLWKAIKENNEVLEGLIYHLNEKLKVCNKINPYTITLNRS